MSTVPINEIFETVQGEATFTGTPAVFIRTQGCPVGCGWCDTKHTWEQKQESIVPIVIMVGKTVDSDTFASMSTAQIVDEVARFSARHVVITGGEPALHDLNEVTSTLISLGYTVQIETSGHFLPRVHEDVFITCSPKMDMPGGSALPEFVGLADEIKWPVGKIADVMKLKQMISVIETSQNKSIQAWLQPLSQSKKATALCVEQATANGWRVSIQTHKYLGVR